MNLSSGYLFARGLTPAAVPPPPYPFYWWRSPGECPVRDVNGYKPSVFWPDNAGADVHTAQIDNSNKYYDGGDIGCNALEITDKMPWGYNAEEHDGNWYMLREAIPLYDANGQESEQYRIMVEFGCYYMFPYEDEDNPGEYWTTSQMRLTDRINQRNVLLNYCDAQGVFKEESHIYMFAGADTFYWIDDWDGTYPTKSMHNIIYSGNIIDARHLYYWYPRVKWAGVVFDLNWIEQELGVHLDPRWV